jgi:hypothetical protein
MQFLLHKSEEASDTEQTAQFVCLSVCLSVLTVHHLYPSVWNYLIFPIQFDAVSHS